MKFSSILIQHYTVGYACDFGKVLELSQDVLLCLEVHRSR